MNTAVRGREVPKKGLRWLGLWGPVYAMMALIFWGSSSPTLPTAASVLDDGVWHAGAYAVLSGLWLRALAGARWELVTAAVALLSAVLATFYGATDEIHQRFVPGRTPELSDICADAAGAVFAGGLIWWVARLRR